jgi:cold shock protein
VTPRATPALTQPTKAGPSTGVVKWFNDEKGYGFVKRDDGVDCFVHHADVKGAQNLVEGQRVTFDMAKTERGPKAVNVSLQ